MPFVANVLFVVIACLIYMKSKISSEDIPVFLRGDDYTNREALMKALQDQVWENQKSKSGPILASGMADFTPGKDKLVSEIFDRADKAMYKNKRDLKK